MVETRTGRVSDVPARRRRDFGDARFGGLLERRIGKLGGLTQFGVNHVVLEPGKYSARRHWHAQEDEFVYVLSGELVLIDDNGEHLLKADDFVGWPAGEANAHHLVNRSSEPAVFLSIGARHRGEERIAYPEDGGTVSLWRGENGNRPPQAPDG